MFRSIPFIIAALGHVGVHGGKAKSYAPILQEMGKKHHLDPVTLIVLIDGESKWNPSIVNSIGCIGLGQHCLQFQYKFCRKGAGYNKAKCDAKKAPYFNGPFNLRATASSISVNRRYCNKKTNKRTKKSRSQWRHWFPSYGGYNKPSKGIWCGQKRVKTKRGWRWRNVAIPKRIAMYMKKRKRIIRAISRKRRRRKRS
jgi:hypothetical protein